MVAKLIFIVFYLIVTKMDNSGASRLKRIENHLGILSAESKFIREEVGNIFEKIDSFPEIFNLSITDIQCKDQRGINDSKVVSKTKQDTNKYTDWRIQLTKAFNKEKLLNTQIRGQLPDLDKRLQTTEKAISRVEEKLVDVQKQITEQFTELTRLVEQQPCSQMEQKDQSDEIADLKNKLQALNKTCRANHEPSPKVDKRSKSCLELLNNGHRTSGQYGIFVGGSTAPIRVYCDQDTLGGGWTVFQRRKDGSVDFYRDWRDYKNGFGDLDGEFWLGNEFLSLLTTPCCHQLRIELEDFEGETSYAMYEEFDVKPENEQYMLKVGRYKGTAGDSLKNHNGMKFSTKDLDNDIWYRSCAERGNGAWWYYRCHTSNLNGRYGVRERIIEGVIWRQWKGNNSLKFSEMKLR